MATINMQMMRYINLLDRISSVKTRKCFIYNNTIFFAVPQNMVSRAIGPNAAYVRELQEKLGRRIRIISEPQGINDASKFIGMIVAPIRFKSLELSLDGFVITAGSSQTKATLLGRNKKRLEELKQIVEDNFHVGLKII